MSWSVKTFFWNNSSQDLSEIRQKLFQLTQLHRQSANLNFRDFCRSSEMASFTFISASFATEFTSFMSAVPWHTLKTSSSELLPWNGCLPNNNKNGTQSSRLSPCQDYHRACKCQLLRVCMSTLGAVIQLLVIYYTQILQDFQKPDSSLTEEVGQSSSIEKFNHAFWLQLAIPPWFPICQPIVYILKCMFRITSRGDSP